MKQILLNDNNLKDSEIQQCITRTKAILINSDNNILLAHNNNTVQFIGGHLKSNETLEECLIREIKEETGINITLEEITPPFLELITYDSNYFNTHKKVKSIIYYYLIRCNKNPNYSETQYDFLELQTKFNLFYINSKNLLKELDKFLNNKKMDSKIHNEMKIVISELNHIINIF